MAVKAALLEYCHTTNIGGIPKIVKNRRIGFRIFWIIFTIIIYILAIWTIANLITHYLSYPKISRTEERMESEPPAFAVTLCDQFPFPASRQATSGASETYSQYLQQAKQLTDCSNCTPEQEQLKSELMSRKGYFQFLTKSQRSGVSHTQSGFILECSAVSGGTRKNCMDALKITPHSLPDYFTCFGLSPKSDSRIESLEMTLFLDRSAPGGSPATINYNSADGPLEGVRVIPHQIGRKYSSRDGFVVNPGQFTNARLKVKEDSLLAPPYGNCDDNSNGKTAGECRREYSERECDCTPAVDESDPPEPSKQYCFNRAAGLDTLKTRLGCLEKSSCDVTEPCDQTRYDVTIETSKWPSTSQMESFIAAVSGYQGYPYTGGETADYVNENFIRLHLTVDRRVTVNTQEVAMSVAELITRVGWTICFLCGITLFSFVEIIECLCKMCCGVDKKDDKVSDLPQKA